MALEHLEQHEVAFGEFDVPALRLRQGVPETASENVRGHAYEIAPTKRAVAVRHKQECAPTRSNEMLCANPQFLQIYHSVAAPVPGSGVVCSV